MKLSAEQIQSNWKVFLHNIETHISDKNDRKQKLLNFYKKYEERIILMPAAHKKEYHNELTKCVFFILTMSKYLKLNSILEKFDRIIEMSKFIVNC